MRSDDLQEHGGGTIAVWFAMSTGCWWWTVRTGSVADRGDSDRDDSVALNNIINPRLRGDRDSSVTIRYSALRVLEPSIYTPRPSVSALSLPAVSFDSVATWQCRLSVSAVVNVPILILKVRLNVLIVREAYSLRSTTTFLFTFSYHVQSLRGLSRELEQPVLSRT